MSLLKKSVIEKRNDEKLSVSVRNCAVLKILVGRNITIPSQQEYDNVKIEYGDIIDESVIPKGDDVIHDV